MVTHYPQARTKENKQGLHYSNFSGLIHRPPADSQGNNFSTPSISRANPPSWASVLLLPTKNGHSSDNDINDLMIATKSLSCCTFEWFTRHALMIDTG
jgi:predicted sugar kinase